MSSAFVILWIAIYGIPLFLVGYIFSRGKGPDSMEPVFAMVPWALVGPFISLFVTGWVLR